MVDIVIRDGDGGPIRDRLGGGDDGQQVVDLCSLSAPRKLLYVQA